MPIAKSVARAALSCAWALALCFAPFAAEAQVGSKAGVAAAVRGPVQQISYRTPQATVGRNLTGGTEIFLGDRIVTGPGGGLQILLLDGTTFSLGPNTSMTIDEFVYNPATGTGKLTASVARGTLRVISGRIARQQQEALRIRLPQATVGVRGTMALFTGNAQGFLIALLGVGANNSGDYPQSFLFVYSNGGGNGIYKTGMGCAVSAAAPICDPKPIDANLLLTLLGQISGQYRVVSLEEFYEKTGLDFAQALALLQTVGGFDALWPQLAGFFQSQNRPGNAPPSTPNGPCMSCY